MSQQFVIQLSNRPGSLGRLARGLAARGINIVRLAGGGAGDHGYAVLTTSDAEATRDVLHGSGYDFVEGGALVLEVPDRPGELATIAERLGDEGIQILGVLVLGHHGQRSEVAITVDDVARARRILGLDEVEEV
jgi:hypothetical protein